MAPCLKKDMTWIAGIPKVGRGGEAAGRTDDVEADPNDRDGRTPLLKGLYSFMI